MGEKGPRAIGDKAPAMRCTHPAQRSGTARSLTPFLLEQHPDPASNAAQRTARAPRPAPSPNLQEEKSLPVASTGLARLCHGGPIPIPEACHGAGCPALGPASPLPGPQLRSRAAARAARTRPAVVSVLSGKEFWHRFYGGRNNLS